MPARWLDERAADRAADHRPNQLKLDESPRVIGSQDIDGGSGSSPSPAPDLPRIFSLEAAGRLDEAEMEYSKLVRERPALLQGWLGLTRLARLKGEWQQCSDRCDEMLARFPAQAMVLLEKAVALERLGRLDEAEAVYRALAQADPAGSEAWRGLIRIARRQSHWGSCLAWCDELLARFPGFVEIMCERASALQSLGQIDAADEAYGEVCSAHPEEYRGWSGWARLAEAREQWDLAYSRWAECSARAPAIPEPYHGMIRASWECGRYEQAAAACTGLRAAGGESDLAVIEQCRIRLAAGDTSVADLARGLLPQPPEKATAGPPVLMIAGNSHLRAVSDAALSFKQGKFCVITETFPKGAFLDSSLTKLAPAWRDALSSWASAHRLFVTIEGNEHAMFGLAQHPMPYRTLHDSGKASEVPYLSWPLLRASLRQSMGSTRATIRTLACFFPGRLVVLESPPPCPSEAPMMGEVAAVLPDVGRYGVASGAARLDLWKMRSEIVLDECRKIGLRFLACPAISQDHEGFLVESAWGDATHGNTVYGRWVLDQILRVAAGDERELR